MSLTNILNTWKDYPSILLDKYPDATQFYARYGPIHFVEGIVASSIAYQATGDHRAMIVAPMVMIARNLQLVVSYGKKD